MTGNDADALDATQEVLITLARRIDRFDGRAAFGTWAYRVATNACLDELRRRTRRPGPMDPYLLPERPSVTASGSADADPASSTTDRLTLDAAVAELPEVFRVAVVLRDVLGLEYTEIAEVLHVPIGTVRSRLARGRAILATALAETFTGNGNPHRPIDRRTDRRPQPAHSPDGPARPTAPPHEPLP